MRGALRTVPSAIATSATLCVWLRIQPSRVHSFRMARDASPPNGSNPSNPSPPHSGASRRAFLGLGAAGVAGAVAAGLAGCSAHTAAASPASPARPAPRRHAVPENSRPGDPNWEIRHLGAPQAIEGYAGASSVLTGESFPLFVS